jgi:hypothetical protein
MDWTAGALLSAIQSKMNGVRKEEEIVLVEDGTHGNRSR